MEEFCIHEEPYEERKPVSNYALTSMCQKYPSMRKIIHLAETSFAMRMCIQRFGTVRVHRKFGRKTHG